MIARTQEVATDGPSVDPTGPEPTGGTTLTRDQIFHLLQNERRRLALTYLMGRDDEVKMRDIAEQVAAWEHDTTLEALDSDQRQRVYIPLYQNHLPKLDDDGVIEYDQSRGTVSRTPLADQLDPYLTDDATAPAPAQADASVRSEPGPWPRYYLATALVSAVLIAGAAVGTPLLGDVPAIAIGAAVVLAFFALTAAQSLSLGAVDVPL